MRNENEILSSIAGLRRETLHVWIERGWLAPQQGRSGYRFREIDVARVRLIQEFCSDLAIDEDALDIILSLIDQIHGLRGELRRLADAISAQPEEVRNSIATSLAHSN